MITPRTILRFLLFDREAIQMIATHRQSLVVGLLLVISAGFAREYDAKNLLAEPWFILVPVAASLVAFFCLFLLLIPLAWCKARIGPHQFFLPLLSVFWMTAPLAWLYAFPFERFLSPDMATRANLLLLGVVAAWRVALMIRCVQVLFNASIVASLMVVALFCDWVTLTAITLLPLPVVSLMGGVQLTDSESIIQGTYCLIGLIGTLTLPIWGIGYLVVWGNWKSKWSWFQSESTNVQPTHQVSRGTWTLVIGAFGLFITLTRLGPTGAATKMEG